MAYNAESLYNKVESTLEILLREFIDHPYLCYTEHGLHALIFQRLFCELSEQERYVSFPDSNTRVCRIQKEYATKKDLGKTQRQHWDIALIGKPKKGNTYDKLPLNCVIEFGLNANLPHLMDDFLRVCHKSANTKYSILVHLYRFSKKDDKVWSRRDLSLQSADNPWKDESCTKFLESLVGLLNVNDFDKIVRQYSNDPENNLTDRIQKVKTKRLENSTVTIYFGMVYDCGGEGNKSGVIYKCTKDEHKKIVGEEWWPNSQ